MKHAWVLVDRAFHIEKHQCRRCKAFKTITTMDSRYPVVRYQVDGVITEGKAPRCSASAKGV